MAKKTERMLMPRLIRQDEAMSAEIRSYADFEQRPLSDELRHLITLGLEQKRIQLGEETVRLLCQLRSTTFAVAGPVSTAVNQRQSASRKTA